MPSDYGEVWKCGECGWVNHGHKDYCTCCLLTDLKNKEVNLSRVQMALRGEFISGTDEVKKIEGVI